MGNPNIVVRPDSVQTARVGLTEMDIETQLNAALYGQVASTIPEQDRMTKIRVRYPDRVRFDKDHLGQLPISLAAAAPGCTWPRRRDSGWAGRGGAASALCRSTNWRRSKSCAARTNCGARISSPSSPSPPSSSRPRSRFGQSQTCKQHLAELKVPSGYRWELAGNYRAQQESFASLLMVLILAAALVFLLLGFQFHSLTLPVLIFLAQPVSLASALFALWITGTPLNVSSFMGAILLIGLDVKNGIILIEYIGQLRDEGVPLHEALLRAGRTRFPADLDDQPDDDFRAGAAGPGLGPGRQMQQPLAIAVIGGLITNMLLTRLLIPVGYLLLNRGAGHRAGRLLSLPGLRGGQPRVTAQRANRRRPAAAECTRPALCEKLDGGCSRRPAHWNTASARRTIASCLNRFWSEKENKNCGCWPVWPTGMAWSPEPPARAKRSRCG